MIVFGHNNFKIKSFTPQELRLPRDEYEGIEIQVRQHYAHLFWIPIFPIGKIYGFKRAGDSSLYELPESIKETIKDRHAVKTPWYSFALLILALLGFGGYAANEELDNMKYENEFYQQQAEVQMMVKYPTTGDFYSVYAYDNADDYTGTKIVLKVNSYNEDSIEFTSGYEDLYIEDVYSYDVSNEFDKAGQYQYNATTISKKDLLELVTEDYQSYNDKKLLIPALDGKYLSFREMKRQDLNAL